MWSDGPATQVSFVVRQRTRADPEMNKATSLQTMSVVLLVAVLATRSMQGEIDSSSTESARDEPFGLVASLRSGREVVFSLDPLRLKRQGLEPKQLEFVRGCRFQEGEYHVRVEGKSIDLASLASIKVRDLHAPSFDVVLPVS